MKRLKILALAAIGLLCSMGVCAQAFQVNGLYYDLLGSNEDANKVVFSGAEKGKTTVDIPSKVTYKGKTYRVVAIANRALSLNKSVTSVKIPNSVTSMNERVFYLCSSLTSVVDHKGVTNIPYSTYEFCTGLKTVVIPDYVTRIESRAFADCMNMEELHIGSQVTFIGSCAFDRCFSLRHVYVEVSDPKQIEMGKGGMYFPNEIHISKGNTKGNTTGNKNDKDANTAATLYVPKRSVEAYKKTPPWSAFQNIIGLDFKETNTPVNKQGIGGNSMGSVVRRPTKGVRFLNVNKKLVK